MGILIFLLLYLLVHIFLSGQLLKLFLIKNKMKKIIFYVCYFFVAFSYLWSRNLPQFISGQIVDKVALVGGLVIADTYYTVLLILFYKIILRFYKCECVLTVSKTKKAMVLICCLLAINIYGIYNAQRQVVTEYVLFSDKLGQLKEIKIVMVSDIHLGKVTEQEFSRQLVAKINSLQPDLVLLVGDIIDSDLESVQRKEQLLPFKNIKAQLGIYGVMGNHEYISGNSKAVLQLLQANNIRILIDEKIRLNETGIVLFGLDDESREKFKNKNSIIVLDKLNVSDYNIVMDHQPKRIKRISEIVGVDLLLSGHTHRGQYFPNNYITQSIYLNDWGLKEINKLTSIVSCGYGNWSAPLRLGSKPEIVVMKIINSTK